MAHLLRTGSGIQGPDDDPQLRGIMFALEGMSKQWTSLLHTERAVHPDKRML